MWFSWCFSVTVGSFKLIGGNKFHSQGRRLNVRRVVLSACNCELILGEFEDLVTLVFRWIHFVMSQCGNGFLIDYLIKTSHLNQEEALIV